MPHVNGILEAALYVEDLGRSAEFYSRVFGFEVIDGGSSRMRALHAGNRQVLLLFTRGGSAGGVKLPEGFIPGHDASGRQHIAFAIPADAVDSWRARLAELGVPVESQVRWPRGGTSLYLRDPDGHSVELVTPGCWPVY